MIDILTLIGVGLISGSLARTLRDAGHAPRSTAEYMNVCRKDAKAQRKLFNNLKNIFAQTLRLRVFAAINITFGRYSEFS